MADDWFVPDAPQTKAGAVDDWAVPREADDVSAGMVLRGIPVGGAYVPHAEAALRALFHPLTGVGSPGSTIAERYAAELPKRQARYAEVEKEQPIASTAAQMLGGALATAPLGATALGAKMLGAAPITATTLGGKALQLGGNVARGAASGAGISAADAAARGEDVGTSAGIGGALGGALPVIGAAAGRIGKTARSYLGSPTADELKPAVDAGYAALRAADLEIKPQAIQSAVNRIRVDAEVHPKLTPQVSGLLDDAANKGIMSPLTGGSGGVKFDDLDALRRQLGAVARDYSKPTEQKAARDAMRGLDDYLAKISPADVLKGDAAQIAKLATETRGNAAAEFRLRAMDALRTRAEDQASKANSGLNVENAYRQQLATFVRPNNKGVSPAKKEGLTNQEIERIRVAMRSTAFPNMLRLVGNVLGGGHGLMAGAGLATSYQTGDPRYAMGVGAGYGMRRMSNAMMRNRAEMLSRMVGARSPLATSMGVGGPTGPALNLGPAQGAILGGAPSLFDMQ